MKLPIKPPSLSALLQSGVGSSSQELTKLLLLGIQSDHQGNYYHWDKLRHLKLPFPDLSHEKWWLAIKIARTALYKKIPHSDKHGKPFVYAEPDLVRRLLHEIDLRGGGEIRKSSQVVNRSTRDAYLVNSLIEEAITSSQLEGAATTRKIAKEMLQRNRKSRDASETMIVNNYRAMEFIKDISQEELTPKFIYELHRILTKDTLEVKAAGRLRSVDVSVHDTRDAKTLHEPPQVKELEDRMQGICDFGNTDHGDDFLHPAVRAIILHFLLAYDHPFEDGNGRTARALFYWSMLKRGYWTMEFISISRILKEAPAKYARAYLYTETDDNDVTYFIVHQLKVIRRAIEDLLIYFQKKSDEIKTVQQLVNKSWYLQKKLNHRQISLMHGALKKPESVFYIESHRNTHNITYETARTDLLKLVDLTLLEKTKIGKAFAFSAVSGLRQKLEGMK